MSSHWNKKQFFFKENKKNSYGNIIVIKLFVD